MLKQESRNKMTFEQNLNKLDKIKEELERADISLDDSINLFKESVELTKECIESLKDTEGKISVIKTELDKIIEKPLDLKED